MVHAVHQLTAILAELISSRQLGQEYLSMNIRQNFVIELVEDRF